MIVSQFNVREEMEKEWKKYDEEYMNESCIEDITDVIKTKNP
jgi:hypothetical protein